jgi:hypothetical protein
MLMTTFSLLALTFAAANHGAEPVIDNERISVWDTKVALPPAQHDFVSVSLVHKGTARFGHAGDKPGQNGARTIVIFLKDHPVAPLANHSGYPAAFPRPHVTKLFENEKVIVWDYVWRPGQPTPMHFHDKDAMVVYEANGALQSSTPDGKSLVNEYSFGDIRFNRRDRTHSELLIRGHAHAVITELK